MDFGILTSLFSAVSEHMTTVYGYTSGILFAWSLSLLIDFSHLKKLTQMYNTKAKKNPDAPALAVLLIAFFANILMALHVFLVPNHLALELMLAIQFWLCVGLLRTTEIVYKSLLFITPSTKQADSVYSWRFLFHP